jgi:diacylglycerol kinase
MHHWLEKFANAFRGIRAGTRGQGSFAFHLLAAILVVAAGVLLKVDLIEWAVLALCIGGVLTAELFNSALEAMARGVSRRPDPDLGEALDIASAAVLLASLAAAAAGSIVLGHRLGSLLGWW